MSAGRKHRTVPVPHTGRIAVSMIVKDAVGTIGKSLGSIRPHVDGVYVLDTGSTDGTLDLLEELAAAPGAPVHVGRGGWHDDFARARNEALTLIPGGFTWLVAVDADEVVHGGGNLRRLLRQLPCMDGMLVCESYVAVDGMPLAVGYFQAVSRLDAGLHWEGTLHATLAPIREGRWAFAPADDLWIEHLCTVDEFLSEARLGNWRRLLLKELDGDDREEALRQLAEIELWLGDPASAVERLQAALDETEEDKARASVYTALALGLLECGRPDEAHDVLHDALCENPLTLLSPQTVDARARILGGRP